MLADDEAAVELRHAADEANVKRLCRSVDLTATTDCGRLVVRLDACRRGLRSHPLHLPRSCSEGSRNGLRPDDDAVSL